MSAGPEYKSYRERGRDLLHQRGIDDAIIAYARITTGPRGWVYPFRAGDVIHQRFKAFPGQGGAKYKWYEKGASGNKPSDATFYDPHGALAHHVAQAGGELILASGEPDVWVCWAAGIFNVTCTLLGEGAIPDWFVEQLILLGVTRVRLWPDRDQQGGIHARSVNQVLQGTGMAVDIYHLPGLDDGKDDLNTLWLACHQDPDAFLNALEACEPYELANTLSSAPAQKSPRASGRAVSNGDLWHQWLTEEFDPRVPADLRKGHVNAKGFYMNTSCPNPHHTDLDPSAGYNPQRRLVHCFVCGTLRVHDLAEMFGVCSWAEYKREHRRDVTGPTTTTTLKHTNTSTLTPAAATLRLNYYPNGIPLTVISLLLGLHQNEWLEPRDAPRAGAFVAMWYAWHRLVLAGDRDPLAPFAIADIIRTSTLSDATVRGAIRFNEFLEFPFLFTCTKDSGREIQKNTRGRPAQHFVFRPLDEAWSHFMAWLLPRLRRGVLVAEYPDVPVTALDIEDLLKTYGAKAGDIAAIDARSQALYHQAGGDLAQAERHLEWRVGVVQSEYIFSPDTTPLQLPAGVSFSNAAQFLDAINRQDLDARCGMRSDRYEVATLTGRSLEAHRESCNRLDIATVPVFQTYPVQPDRGVLSQCEALDATALARGHVELCAPNGRSTKVWAQTASFNYDTWLARNGGVTGATLNIWTGSVEKYASALTEADRAAQDKVQRWQQNASARRGYQAVERKPSEQALWLRKQAVLRAEQLGMQVVEVDGGRQFISASGEVFSEVDLWSGIINQVQDQPFAALDKGDVSGPSGFAPDGESAVLEREAVERPPDVENMPGAVLHPAAVQHECACCDAPAEYVGWGGWYCAAHQPLGLDEQLTLARKKRGSDSFSPG